MRAIKLCIAMFFIAVTVAVPLWLFIVILCFFGGASLHEAMTYGAISVVGCVSFFFAVWLWVKIVGWILKWAGM